MSELTLVEMETCPDDVVINILGPYDGDLLSIYDRVRDLAKTYARNSEKLRNKKMLVEMFRNVEGYPTADIYCEGKIIHRVFATEKATSDAIDSGTYNTAYGRF
jgi:hypothetical protein